MSKYEPLQKFFEQAKSVQITLSFEEVEKILGAKLPASAKTHQAWWANNPTGHSHCRAWVDAGWRTENLNLRERKVDFVHVDPQMPHSVQSTRRHGSGSPFGALSGTLTVHDQSSLTAPTDPDWFAQSGKV